MKTIKHGSQSFFFATLFLPPRYWASVNTLYSFCRAADDIVDASLIDEPANLTRRRLYDFYNSEKVSTFFRDTGIPIKYFNELIQGVESDLIIKEYNTFDELYQYCYRVAGTVGIMMSYMLGNSDSQSLKYAEQLGVAMQITNILRDLKEDSQKNRFYIPQQDMEMFNVNKQDLINGTNDQRIQKLIEFYIGKADYYFDEGNKGIKRLPKSTRFSIKVASNVYRQILRKIEQNNFNVMEKRIYTTKKEKFKIALRSAF